MSLYPIHAPVAASGPLSLSLVATGTASTNATSFTFSATAVGDANGTKKLVIGIQTQSASEADSTISSLTVDGNAAALVARVAHPSGVLYTAEMYELDWSGGGTEDIVVSYPLTVNSCGIAVYAVLNAAGATVADTDTDTTLSTTLSGSVTVAEDGVIIGYACRNDASGFGWNAELVEDVDEEIESGAGYHSGASSTYADLTTTPTPTITCTAGTSRPRLVLGAWNPP
jgi:hypothetical protein